MSRLQESKNYFKDADLDKLLDEITVYQNEDVVLNGWWVVSNHQGIIAFFGTEKEACHYRLDFINRILN
jgi:hypothetical protein